MCVYKTFPGNWENLTTYRYTLAIHGKVLIVGWLDRVVWCVLAWLHHHHHYHLVSDIAALSFILELSEMSPLCTRLVITCSGPLCAASSCQPARDACSKACTLLFLTSRCVDQPFLVNALWNLNLTYSNVSRAGYIFIFVWYIMW